MIEMLNINKPGAPVVMDTEETFDVIITRMIEDNGSLDNVTAMEAVSESRIKEGVEEASKTTTTSVGLDGGNRAITAMDMEETLKATTTTMIEDDGGLDVATTEVVPGNGMKEAGGTMESGTPPPLTLPSIPLLPSMHLKTMGWTNSF